MTEENYRFHDTFVKWLTLLLAVGGFVIALTTYSSQQKAARDQNAELENSRREQLQKEALAREEEYKRRFWERQLDLYFQACKATTTLASIANQKHADYEPARMRFEQLFNGELCIIESQPVASQMIRFRDALHEYEKNGSEEKREQLRQLSLKLAYACRDSTASAWKVSLGKIELKK